MKHLWFHRENKVSKVSQHLLLVSIVNFLVCRTNGFMVGNDPYRRLEILDPEGKYQLEWNWSNENRITFNVTVETRGCIGFGLSKDGNIADADVVVGGVYSNGEAYFSDRHGVPNGTERDPVQDWIFHQGWESATQTMISFSRDLDTCDPQDYPITDNRVSLIWWYGLNDNDDCHCSDNRARSGTYYVYLLQPDYSPHITRDFEKGITRVIGKDSADLKVWSIPRKMELPQQDTTYWCTMHAAPKLSHKHHVVGFDVHVGSDISRQHTHHLIMYKCNVPPGVDSKEVFEPYLQHEGQQCLRLDEPNGPMPTDYCTEIFNIWGIGGRAFFMPPHVGFPFGQQPDEYYVLQVHYDNPNREPNVVVDLQLDFFYTSKLRQNDAGIFYLSHEAPGVPPSVLIPPGSTNHKIYGHCSSECTNHMLPKGGINVVATFLHSHTIGQKVLLQDFRNNRELHWISSDDNYNFDFQQLRALPKDFKVLPGDHLVMSCVYDNLEANGTVVGGFGSRQEMCTSFSIYYNKMEDYVYCRSELISEDYRRRFLGVSNMTWDDGKLEFVVDKPQPLAGLTISQVSDNHVSWDRDTIAELQRFHFYHPQINICQKQPEFTSGEDTVNGTLSNQDNFSASTIYPVTARVYQPQQTCSFFS